VRTIHTENILRHTGIKEMHAPREWTFLFLFLHPKKFYDMGMYMPAILLDGFLQNLLCLY
jgi:hypothetical protein